MSWVGLQVFLYNFFRDPIRTVANHLGYYSFDQLQGWGHCGCCGKFIENEVHLKCFSWGLCDECAGL